MGGITPKRWVQTRLRIEIAKKKHQSKISNLVKNN